MMNVVLRKGKSAYNYSRRIPWKLVGQTGEHMEELLATYPA